MIEIIAEIGQNHNGDMNLAKELINAAKDCGADVAKFQVFDAKSLFPKKGNPWYEYNCSTELSRDNVLELNEECRKIDIEFFGSVFHVDRIDWLENLGIKRYKIASRSINDHELISKLELLNKPLIVSLGMWEKEYLPEINSQARVDFLYCISKYPTEFKDLKFSEVDFNKYSGFSDHTIGITASIIALTKGAKILEKHFTIDRSLYGPDHHCSMTPGELQQLNKFRCELPQCL